MPAWSEEEMPTPDLEGAHGRAWRGDIEARKRGLGEQSKNDATLGWWIIEAPWAHMAWHSYVLTLVHLRPIGDPPLATKFYLEGATHEMWLDALDPSHPRVPGISDLVMARRLTPKNFAAQFIEADDAAAIARCEVAVREIVDGVLSPDTDFTREWARRFGDNMLKDRLDPGPGFVHGVAGHA